MSSPSWFPFRRSGFRIELDYPIDAQPRYGYGKPAHPILQQRLEQNRDAYARRLSQFVSFADDLVRIPLVAAEGSVSPCWKNGFLPGLDAVALYGLVAAGNPRRYFEIGSGYSTRFVRQAIGDHGLRTAVTSIDPSPRAAVEPICDRRFSTGVEQAPVELFDELEAGDILFVDSSHRAFTNSDVTTVFIDILPRLAPGVLVQFHDIFWPWDYPPEWSGRYYSEQYLLACYLLAGGERMEIALPNAFISGDDRLGALLSPLWERPELAGVERHGCSFWIQIK
ncbi:MAG TPA: class I SAM-dependent methyltransferase [Bryobacteraceae bacterium]|nr:class I SAM-dependent methyltransferase [Bryobacteraceae bacterium]